MAHILITNIDGTLGMYTVAALQAMTDAPISGTSRSPHRTSLPGLPVDALVPAPTSDQELVALLRDRRIDIVIHLDLLGEEAPVLHGEVTLQHNVLATQRLLGACTTAGVRRIVLRSSTLVYGARANQPAFLDEDTPVADKLPAGLLREYGGLDRGAALFAAHHNQPELVWLRCASLVAADSWSPLAHYLIRPTPRLLLGYNPRLQLLHPADAADAFARAALSDVTGPLNIAATDPLTIVQLVRLARQQPLWLADPLVDLAAFWGQQRTMLHTWPYGRDALRYDCVAALDRAFTLLGWQPAFTAHELVKQLAPDATTTEEDDRSLSGPSAPQPEATSSYQKIMIDIED